jgi:signal transduction histidine kinase
MNSKILFVDDDEGNLAVCDALWGEEFDILTAEDAATALHMLHADDSIGVVVADQRMPGMTGVELLEKVRDERPDVVRLLLTAYSDLDAAVDAINRGQVRRYLKKPWEPTQFRAELRDALELHQMSRKLDALNQRLRETERVYSLGIIAASVGHEIRNPVTWLHGSLETARQRVASLNQALADTPVKNLAEPHIKALQESIDNALGGVDRLFDIVRGIAMPLSSRPPEPSIVDLGDVLEVTLSLLAHEMRTRGQLIRELQSRPRVRGNSNNVSQILLNLLVNATQALVGRPASQNVIRVTLESEGAFAKLEVGDNGPGIPDEDRDRVFDPLFTTRQDGGTGLGLAISRRLANELGGTLSVSQDPGLGGALFCLRLPRVDEPPVIPR